MTILPAMECARAAASIYLVRHAQSVSNASVGAPERDTDSPLTELGQTQARALTTAFQYSDLSEIVCSDTARARETVAEIARTHGLSARESDRLREPRQAARSTQVLDLHDARAMLEQLRVNPPTTAITTETHAELLTRLRAEIAAMEGALEARRGLVICSHFVTMNVLLRLLTDPRDPTPGLWARFENASVTRVDVDVASGRRPLTGTLVYANWVC